MTETPDDTSDLERPASIGAAPLDAGRPSPHGSAGADDVPRMPAPVRDRVLAELAHVYHEIKRGRTVGARHLAIVAAQHRLVADLMAGSGDARVQADVARFAGRRGPAALVEPRSSRTDWNQVAAALEPFGMAPEVERLSIALTQLPAAERARARLDVERDGVSSVFRRCADRTAAADLWDAMMGVGELVALFDDLARQTGEPAYLPYRDICLVAFGGYYEAWQSLCHW